MPQDQQQKTELSLDDFREQARERYGIPKGLWESVRGQESGGDPNAVSPTGVRGELQVTKKTAAGYGLDRDDPFHQIAAAAKNLREGYDHYSNVKDDNQRWLAATGYYYYGPGAVAPDGTLNTKSKDGVSTPAQHITKVARLWKSYNDSQSSAPAAAAQSAEQMDIDLRTPQSTKPAPKAQPGFNPGDPNDPFKQPQSRPQTASERRLATDEVARRQAAPQIAKMVGDFEMLKSKGDVAGARSIAAQIKGKYGNWMEVGEGNGWPYVKSRVAGWDPIGPAPGPASTGTPMADLERKAAIDDYNKQSWLERRRREISTGYDQGALGLSDILARGYDIASGALTGNFQPLIEQAEGAGRGLLKLASAFDPVNAEETYAAVAKEQDPALEALERRRAVRLKDDPYTIGSNIERRRLNEEAARQPGFGGSVTRGVTSGALQSLPYIAASALGGGVPTMGSLAAAQSDFVHPEEAALNIAGATLPIKVGRAVAPAVERVATALPGKVLPAAARAGGQVGFGGATNVATALAAGERDPSNLAEQFVTGGVLSGVDALRAARDGALNPRDLPAEPVETRPSTPPQLNQQEMTNLEIGRVIDRYTQAADAIQRSNLRPEQKAVELAKAREAYIAEREAVSPRPQSAMRDPQSGIEFQPWPRTPEGAIVAPESPVANRRLLPPAPSAPETTMLPTEDLAGYPDAPPTQESPALRQWMEAENAVTGEFPPPGDLTGQPLARQTGELPRTTPRLLPAEPTGEAEPIRRTAELAPQRPERSTVTLPRTQSPPERPQTVGAPRIEPDIPAVTQEPTSRIATGEGADLPRRVSAPLEGQPIEMPGPGRRPTERLPVPIATPENIEALRRRRDDLSRVGFDRRGDFTGDLRDELRELGAVIARYDADQAKAGRGNAFDPDAAPNYAPAERPRPETPEDAAARRLAFEPGPRPSGLLQASTPGRPVTQEVQIPSARNVRTDFNSREDARRGHFDSLTDDELVAEIDRLQDVRNDALGGRSRLSPEEIEANNFDLKIAVEQQKERGRIQRAQGRDAANRIAPRVAARAPKARQIQHSTYGLVTVAPDQKGVPTGKVRVTGEDGQQHLIQNPRTRGNREASFVKSAPAPRSTGPIPGEAMPELRAPNAPPSPMKGKPPSKGRPNYAIPDEAMPELRDQPRRQGKGTYMGAGLGALQPLFERGGKKPQSKTPTLFEGAPNPDGLTTREQIGRKIGTVQTIAQLLNPKTISQNIIGNAAFAGGKNLANVVALPVDKILSAFTKQRQVATPQLKAQISDFKKGFTEIYHAVKQGDYGKLSDNRYELSDQRVFKGKVGGFFEDVMNVALRAPDRGAYLAAYNDSVQQILAANKKSKQPFSLDKIHEQAQIEAQQATFQDSNLISDFATKLRDGLNTVTPFGKKANFGLGDLVGLKYAKTPANLVARGVEYSPLGFVNAFYKMGKVLAGKSKGFDQRDASLAFGKAFVGSAFGSGLGAALYSMGVITQPELENRGLQAAERAEGLSGYQVNLSALKRYATGGLLDALTGDLSAGKKQAGDVLMSYDWLQPWAFSLGMGASAAKAFQKRKADADLLEDTLTQIDAVTSTLTDQSILRNIRDAFKKGAKETGRKLLTDTPASFVPSALNLARQIIDDRARETSKERGVEGIKREALEKVLNRLPGASQSLPERKDLVGRSVPSRLEGAGGAALAMVPGRFNQYNPNPVLSQMQETGAGTTDIQRKDGESEGAFRARRARAAEWRNQYGLKLTSSQAYQSATPERRKAALKHLETQISAQSDEGRPKKYLFSPASIFEAVREAERNKKRKAAQAGAALQ